MFNGISDNWSINNVPLLAFSKAPNDIDPLDFLRQIILIHIYQNLIKLHLITTKGLLFLFDFL